MKCFWNTLKTISVRVIDPWSINLSTNIGTGYRTVFYCKNCLAQLFGVGMKFKMHWTFPLCSKIFNLEPFKVTSRWMACNYLPLFLFSDSYAERRDICRSFSELNLIDNNNIGSVFRWWSVVDEKTFLIFWAGFRIRIDLMRIRIRIRIQHFF